MSKVIYSINLHLILNKLNKISMTLSNLEHVLNWNNPITVYKGFFVQVKVQAHLNFVEKNFNFEK